MTTNLFKSFTPCEINGIDIAGTFSDFEVEDPSPTSWRSIGLTRPFGEGFIQDIGGNIRVMAVQINERILPGKVMDEKVAEKIAAWQRESGHNASKKDYAQARDEVEHELLPKAFIRRQVIPVVFARLDDIPVMLVFTSSPKKLEDVFLCAQGALPALRAQKIATKTEAWRVLTDLAKNGWGEAKDRLGCQLWTDSIAVLVSANEEDKRKVRVKDRAIEAGEIQNLFAQGYVAAELGLIMSDIGNEACSMTVTERHIYKGAKIVEKEDDESDPVTTAYLTIRQYLNFLALFVRECGGIERAEWEPAADDDEL